jgi:hypothetical protein
MKHLDTLRPRFTHDCSACRFIRQDGEYDVYWCRSGFQGGSVIARMGSDGPNYSSIPVSTVLYSECDSATAKVHRRTVAYLARFGMIEVHINDKAVADWDEANR